MKETTPAIIFHPVLVIALSGFAERDGEASLVAAIDELARQAEVQMIGNN